MGMFEFGTVGTAMVVWRKSIVGGRVATAQPLLSARAMPHVYPCGVRATAAHKYVWSFTHTRGVAVCLLGVLGVLASELELVLVC